MATTDYDLKRWVIGAVALVTLSFLLVNPIEGLAKPAKLDISIEEVSTQHSIEIQLTIIWGAEIPTSEWKPQWTQIHQERIAGNRNTSKLRIRTATFEVDERVRSLIVFGRIASNDGTTYQWLPAKFLQATDPNSLAQLRVSVTADRDFTDAFRDSYPFDHEAPIGFITDETVLPSLRSIKAMLEYASSLKTEVPQAVFSDLNFFFNSNRRYFKKGGEQQLTEILKYLKTYSSLSSNDGVNKFYVQFLNELVSEVQGQDVFKDMDITDYLHSELLRLYDTHLVVTFDHADRSLEKFEQIRRYKQCFALAAKILTRIDTKLLEELMRIAPKNLFSIMVHSTRCGEGYFRQISSSHVTGNSASTDGAKLLAEDTESRAMLEQYVRIGQLMADKGYLPLQGTGRTAEVSKFLQAYRAAI